MEKWIEDLTDEQIRRILTCVLKGSIHTDKEMPVPIALDYMTDEWIEQGNYSDTTLIDTRNACRQLLMKCDGLRKKFRMWEERSNIMREALEHLTTADSMWVRRTAEVALDKARNCGED